MPIDRLPRAFKVPQEKPLSRGERAELLAAIAPAGAPENERAFFAAIRRAVAEYQGRRAASEREVAPPKEGSRLRRAAEDARQLAELVSGLSLDARNRFGDPIAYRSGPEEKDVSRGPRLDPEILRSLPRHLAFFARAAKSVADELSAPGGPVTVERYLAAGCAEAWRVAFPGRAPKRGSRRHGAAETPWAALVRVVFRLAQAQGNGARLAREIAESWRP